jgi:hypothetical protein
MPVGYRNLSGYVKGLVNGTYPDIGQVYFVVDSNYRTDTQGWSRSDRTGPLDLYDERSPGYVFRTGDYSRDQLAIQAAIDETIDYRGDIVYFTPGAYSIATTALAINSANIRLIGPPIQNPRRAAATITDVIGDNAVSVDNVEIAHLRVVPLTAQNFFQIANGADYGYIHHCYYDAQGVAASTSTEFVQTAASTQDWLVEKCAFVVDDLQGDCFTWTTALHWIVQDCYFLTKVASYATVFTLATACQGNLIQRCVFTADADGTFTKIATGATNENGQLTIAYCTINGTALATVTDIETGFGTTTDIEIVENYQTGDATGQGGTLITLA